MAEKHDVFLQVTQAPVLVITNSFLKQISDKREERRGRRKEGETNKQTIITWSKKKKKKSYLIFPLSSEQTALLGMRE